MHEAFYFTGYETLGQLAEEPAMKKLGIGVLQPERYLNVFEVSSDNHSLQSLRTRKSTDYIIARAIEDLTGVQLTIKLTPLPVGTGYQSLLIRPCSGAAHATAVPQLQCGGV